MPTIHDKQNIKVFHKDGISMTVLPLASGSIMVWLSSVTDPICVVFSYITSDTKCVFFLQHHILVIFFHTSSPTLWRQLGVQRFSSILTLTPGVRQTPGVMGYRPTRLPPLEMPAASGVPKIPTLLPADYQNHLLRINSGVVEKDTLWITKDALVTQEIPRALGVLCQESETKTNMYFLLYHTIFT